MTIAAYEYIGLSVIERKYSNPTTDVICQPSYVNLSRLRSAHTCQGSTDILKFSYNYEPDTFNISQIKFDHKTNPADPCDVFVYDDLDRLATATYGVDDTIEFFTMDNLSDRNSVIALFK